jgi:hypothetical protein
MEELSRATACPTPFELLAYLGCENPNWIEEQIHRHLDKYRVNSAREFFRAPVSEIAHTFATFHDCRDALFDWPLGWEVQVDNIRESRKWRVDYFLAQEADPVVWFHGFE